jgi:hypothetical protein
VIWIAFHKWVYMRTEIGFLARRVLLIGFFSLCAAALLRPATVSADQAAPAAKKYHKSSKKTPASPPVVASGPLQALPLDQIPSSAPQVSYANHQLTIVSRNSTLGDILRAVQKQTGAVVEMPSNSTERAIGSFGPGPARDVLASLLNGSHFNYVLLGSPVSASELDRVILITKSGPDDVAPAAEASVTKPGQSPLQMGGSGQGVPSDADASADSDDSQDDADDSSSAAAADDTTQPQAAPVKTPEQLLQELQRQQMIQQQQQNGGAPQGFPAGQPMPQNLQPQSH